MLRPPPSHNSTLRSDEKYQICEIYTVPITHFLSWNEVMIHHKQR